MNEEFLSMIDMDCSAFDRVLDIIFDIVFDIFEKGGTAIIKPDRDNSFLIVCSKATAAKNYKILKKYINIDFLPEIRISL